MTAPREAAEAIEKVHGCLPLRCACGELSTCDGEQRCGCHNAPWTDRGCPVAVAAADAALTVLRAALAEGGPEAEQVAAALGLTVEGRGCTHGGMHLRPILGGAAWTSDGATCNSTDQTRVVGPWVEVAP